MAKEYPHQIRQIIGAKEISYRLEPQPKNKHDPNAILITAKKKGFLWSNELVLGFLPRKIAKEVTERGLAGALTLRPREIWEGDRGGFSFSVDLVGPKETYAQFEAHNTLEEQEAAAQTAAKPATSLQKQYYKFFGIKIARGTTKGQADEFMQRHRDLMTKAADNRLKYWDAFEYSWDELSDSEAREDLGIEKPSLSLAIKTFQEWVKEEDFSEEDLEDTMELVDRLIEAKPDLERD